MLKIIMGIVVAACVAVGVLYFTSDVYRARLDAAADQYAHWTPENIAKDPENYLAFCEQQANKALIDLKASEISVAQSRGKLEAMRADAQNKIAVGDKALVDLKDLFRKTEASNAWPAEWQGQKRDKDWMKRQIVALDQQVEAQKQLKGKVEVGLKKLDGQVTRVQQGRAQVQSQLAEIKIGRDMLKVQRITDELTVRLVNIKSVLQATASTASETSGVISLDQLAVDSAVTVDDSQFDKIMGQ